MVKVSNKLSDEKATPGQKPKICLSMPLYNQVKYLPEALNSLLAQTYSDFRLIIADDSTEVEPNVVLV